MKQLVALFILCFLGSPVFGQDSTYFKSGYAGGYLVVPKGENWLLDRAFVNDGTAYSIKINNSNFQSSYSSGDTIRLPYYIAEMELLDKKEMVQYQLYIRLNKGK